MSITEFDENLVIREHFDGVDDPEISSFLPLSSRLIMKEENLELAAWAEYIDAYLSALRYLSSSAYDNAKDYKGLLRPFVYPSLPIPYLFLCRHLVEITFKAALLYKEMSVEKSHDLYSVWNACKEVFEEKIPAADMEGIDRLVCFLEKMDDRGTRMRYASDGKGDGDSSIDTFFLLNSQKLISYIDDMVFQLREVGLIPECQISKIRAENTPLGYALISSSSLQNSCYCW